MKKLKLKKLDVDFSNVLSKKELRVLMGGYDPKTSDVPVKSGKYTSDASGCDDTRVCTYSC